MMNKNIFHSYLEIGRAEDGAPLFKKSARFDSPECGFNNRTRIFKSRDGNTYAFFATPQGLFRAKVDSISGKFSFFGKLLKCGQFCAIVENPDGSYYIYTSAKTVLKEPEKKEVHPWNGQRYVPFDGSYAQGRIPLVFASAKTGFHRFRKFIRTQAQTTY
ncbi:MAG: hypothetical protein ACLUKN_05645 [Bacilli bacterium]